MTDTQRSGIRKHWGPPGVLGQGFHDLLMRELEVGWLVAITEDAEACGFGPLFDLQVALDPAMQES